MKASTEQVPRLQRLRCFHAVRVWLSLVDVERENLGEAHGVDRGIIQARRLHRVSVVGLGRLSTDEETPRWSDSGVDGGEGVPMFEAVVTTEENS